MYTRFHQQITSVRVNTSVHSTWKLLRHTDWHTNLHVHQHMGTIQEQTCTSSNKLIQCVGTSLLRYELWTTVNPLFWVHTPHATRLKSMQSVFMNRRHLLTMSNCFSSVSCLSPPGAATLTRPLHFSGLINLSYNPVWYSTHAQPMCVTFTLLAYAKCRAILETHCSWRTVTPHVINN